MALNWASNMPWDASLSDRYTSGRYSFSSLQSMEDRLSLVACDNSSSRLEIRHRMIRIMPSPSSGGEMPFDFKSEEDISRIYPRIKEYILEYTSRIFSFIKLRKISSSALSQAYKKQEKCIFYGICCILSIIFP